MTQLLLPFIARPDYAEADFVAASSNAEALVWLGRTMSWPIGRLILWGEAGSGKTHLLHIWARRQGGAVCDGGALQGWPAPPEGGIAVDDADHAAPEPLLHLLNMAAEAGLPVLLAARRCPAAWPARLPDLGSRLLATASVRLCPPDDVLLHGLLVRLLSQRQLTVPDSVVEWMLLHLPRTADALRNAVARLDRVAMATGRKINRAMAAALLADQMAESD
jgi:chromosomal replication initiation ATPase DnaA